MLERASNAIRRRLTAPAPLAKVLTACGRFFNAWGIALCTAVIVIECAALVAQRMAAARLRHDVDALRQDNVQLREAVLAANKKMTPFERKANELYPELGTPEAVARLAKELDDVRQLSLRDVFRPLSVDVHRDVVNRLKGIREKHAALNPKVLLKFQLGDRNRELVASELAGMLERTGIAADVTSTIVGSDGGRPSSLTLTCQRDTVPFAEDLMKALSVMLSTPIAGQIQNEMPSGELQIQLYGTPRFLYNGAIRFE